LLETGPERRHPAHPETPLGIVWLTSPHRLMIEVSGTSRPPPAVQSAELYRGTQLGASSNERKVNRPVKKTGNEVYGRTGSPTRARKSGDVVSSHSQAAPQNGTEVLEAPL